MVQGGTHGIRDGSLSIVHNRIWRVLRKGDDNSFMGLERKSDMQKAAQEDEDVNEELHVDVGRAGDV